MPAVYFTEKDWTVDGWRFTIGHTVKGSLGSLLGPFNGCIDWVDRGDCWPPLYFAYRSSVEEVEAALNEAFARITPEQRATWVARQTRSYAWMNAAEGP